ncbi:ISKra4 family transposase, partial [Phormidesmis priestleyi ULC007]
YLEKCCLLVSANNSYQRTAEDLAMLTPVSIAHSTQQRLVHRHDFEPVVVDEIVNTVSIDGGKVRLRPPLGQESLWNDYKAVTLGEQAVAAYFQQNQTLGTWVNAQPLAPTLSCLGDGHDGIWNLFAQIGNPHQRREVLDWFHLMENLHKVAVPATRCHQIREYLWQGNLNQAIWALLRDATDSALKFIAYLQTHRTRIPD